MPNDGPVIIEAAINGATPKSRNSHVPRSVDEIVVDAVACVDAGAAIRMPESKLSVDSMAEAIAAEV